MSRTGLLAASILCLGLMPLGPFWAGLHNSASEQQRQQQLSYALIVTALLGPLIFAPPPLAAGSLRRSGSPEAHPWKRAASPRPDPLRRPRPATSSATPTVRRSHTSNMSWSRGVARQRTCSSATRRSASPSTSPSCRSCYSADRGRLDRNGLNDRTRLAFRGLSRGR
jgi:hypothetical protein